MDKRADGRNRRGQDEWADGRTGGETNQTDGKTKRPKRAKRPDRRADGRTERRTERTERQAERTERQAERTDCRDPASPFGRFAKRRTESCRRRRKNDNPAPEKPDGSESDGSGGRERIGRKRIGRKWRPGAEAGSGSTKKTIRNQRTIISVCPSALTLCDARQ